MTAHLRGWSKWPTLQPSGKFTSPLGEQVGLIPHSAQVTLRYKRQHACGYGNRHSLLSIRIGSMLPANGGYTSNGTDDGELKGP